MKTTTGILFIAVATTCAAPAAALPLEGFEIPELGARQAAYFPKGAAWRFGGTTGSGIQRNGSGWGAANAPQGRQTAFLQGGDARISQQVQLPRGTFTLSFMAARRPWQAGVANPVQVRVNGQPVGAPIVPAGTSFERYSTPAFTIAQAGPQQVELVSTNASPGDFTTFVDNVAITPLGAEEPLVVEILPDDAESRIRADIGRHTFGSGFEFHRAEIRMTMEPALGFSPATGEAIGAFNLGLLRFPNGTPALHYLWDQPTMSWTPTPSGQGDTVRNLSPAEIQRYTAPERWNMERLFQVNTEFTLNSRWTGYDYVNDHANQPLPPQLNRENLDKAARKAADWVAADQGRTTYWEVGNEDWARWRADQYADIFAAFQAQMTRSNPGIRLLAQGLMEPWADNTPEQWLAALRARLGTTPLRDVHAYSVHQYLRTDPYAGDDPLTRRRKQTQDLLGQVASGEPVARTLRLLGRGQPASPTGHWQLWMTEFNVLQPTGEKRANGQDVIAVQQDMGHALVIADWTGQLLQQGVDRLVMLSLDHHPAFALLQYDRNNDPGTSLASPQATAPGLAFAVYPQAFGRTMVRTTIANNPRLTAASRARYDKLGAYASVSADGRELRAILVNRDLDRPARVQLGMLAVSGNRRLAGGPFTHRQLSAPQLTDSNFGGSGLVRWRTPAALPPPSNPGLLAVELPPASVSLVIAPLLPP